MFLSSILEYRRIEGVDKAKVLMLGIVLFLVLVVGFVGFREAMSRGGNSGCEEDYLRICRCLVCASDKPPYFVGEKYYLWINTTVSADANVSDVVVNDQLGEEFMIVGVSFVRINRPGPYNYTFEYGAYEPGGSVSVTDGASVWTGYLDETGVTFDDFVVYWSDETLKVNFRWDVGSMDEGEAKKIFLTISTDTNPDGLQEFVSPGTYFLHSGATAEGIVESTGKNTSAESTGISIEVLEKVE